VATITGGPLTKDVVALSVCPSCCQVWSTLKTEIIKPFTEEAKP
jgi:hypothetical protein